MPNELTEAQRRKAFAVLMNHLDLPTGTVLSAKQTFDKLGADSLDVVEIGILLQTNFALDAWALPDWSLETTLAEVERDLAKVLPAAPSKSSVTG